MPTITRMTAMIHRIVAMPVHVPSDMWPHTAWPRPGGRGGGTCRLARDARLRRAEPTAGFATSRCDGFLGTGPEGIGYE
jgi:hypothetical protein